MVTVKMIPSGVTVVKKIGNEAYDGGTDNVNTVIITAFGGATRH